VKPSKNTLDFLPAKPTPNYMKRTLTIWVRHDEPPH
jgi:hypothetical protein